MGVDKLYDFCHDAVVNFVHSFDLFKFYEVPLAKAMRFAMMDCNLSLLLLRDVTDIESLGLFSIFVKDFELRTEIEEGVAHKS